MTQIKHTPGPWQVNETNKPSMLSISKPDIEWAIASLYCDPMSEEMEANATLIAAAPQLLEKLSILITAIETEGGYDAYYTEIKEAKEFYNKITGTEKH